MIACESQTSDVSVEELKEEAYESNGASEVSSSFRTALANLEDAHSREVDDLKEQIAALRAALKERPSFIGDADLHKPELRCDVPTGMTQNCAKLGAMLNGSEECIHCTVSTDAPNDCSSAFRAPMSEENELLTAILPCRVDEVAMEEKLIQSPTEDAQLMIDERDRAAPLFGRTVKLLKVKVKSASGLRRADWVPGKSSDPYCVVRLEGENGRTDAATMQTKVAERTLDPKWNHEFVIAHYLPGDSLVFEVFDKDWGPSSDDSLGKVTLPSAEFDREDGFEGELVLTDTGNDLSHLKVSIDVLPVSEVDESLICLLPHWITDNKDVDYSRQSKTSISAKISKRRRSFQRSSTEVKPMEDEAHAGCTAWSQPLDPGSPVRLSWDMLGMVVLIIELLWIPMQVFDPPDTAGVQTLGWITLLYWTTDVFVSFNTSVLTRQGKLVQRRSYIACQYCKGWLFFDLFLIGIDWGQIIINGVQAAGSGSVSAARAARIARLMRMVRLLRLARLAKIRQILFRLEMLIDSEAVMVYFAVGRNIAIILAVNHFLACLWYLTGNDEQGWVRSHGFSDTELEEKYVVSLQWSMAQFTPGAPPLNPTNLRERVFHTLVLALAIVVATVFVSSITSSMSAAWSSKRYASTQSFLLRKYLSQNKVPLTLAIRITRYVGCVLELRQKKIPANQVFYLTLLSAPLHDQLQTEIALPFLLVHPFFYKYRKTSRTSIGLLCTNSLGAVSFAKKDYLFSTSKPTMHMIFVSSGNSMYRCLLSGPLHRKRAKVAERQWCCEGFLWMEWTHTGEMKAMMDVSSITLPTKKFYDNVCTNHDILLLAQKRAKEFLKEARALSVFEVGPTDLPLDFLTGDGDVGEDGSRSSFMGSLSAVVATAGMDDGGDHIHFTDSEDEIS